MKKSSILKVLIAVFVFTFACRSFAVVRIMPCGDSITYDNDSVNSGDPSSVRDGYRSHLWYALQAGGYDVDFVGSVVAGEAIVPAFDPDNEGHPGWTDSQIESNIYDWLVSTPADIVLLHIGTNSLSSDPDQVAGILNEIDDYETFSSKHVTVLLARIINRMSYSSTTTQFNDNVEAMAVSRIAAGDDIIMVDMEDGAGINYTTDMTDNLHPNDTGYQKMAALWYSHLVQILEEDCPTSMTHYYKFNEAASPFEDSISGNNAACSAACPFWMTGFIGNGQLFDSTAAAEVDIPDDDTFDWGPTDSFTIEFWMKKSSPVGATGGTSDNEVIVGRDETGDSLLHWWIGVQNTTGGARFQLRDTNGDYMAALEGPAVDDGVWHHVVAVRNGTKGDILLYVDGALEDSDNYNYTAGFDSATAAINIGWMNLAPNYYYDGILDELAVYDSALSDTDISAHYTAGLLVAAYCSVQPTQAACPDGMVSYWKFEESTGDTYGDSYGPHDADGSVGTPTPGVAGIVGNALSFNGTSDYITVSDNAAFDWAADASFTVELWAQFTNVAARNKVMIGRDQGPGSPHWWLGAQQNTGLAVFNLRDSGGAGIAVTGTTAIDNGSWHHIVAVRDESVNENRLYVDGALAGSDTHDYASGFGASTTIGIGYMAYNMIPDYFYDGALDEIAIYNRALKIAEIQAHYTAGMAGDGYCTTDQQLPFSLKINCGGPTVVDGSITWEAGSTYVTGGNDFTFTTPSVDTAANSIAEPVPPLDVYKTVRHQSPHTYNIPQVPDGDYIVRIHWTDQYGPVGTRQIDYEIEGFPVQDNWDIVAEAGDINTAIDKMYIVTVSDGNGMQIVSSTDTGNDAFESAIEITALTSMPPTITSTPVTAATACIPYTYDVEAIGFPAPVYSLSVYPAGMTIDPNSGLIEWTPDVLGDVDVTVIAANGETPDAEQSFMITVIDTGPYPSGMVGYWTLDETVGAPYADVFAGNDATCSACPVPSTGTVAGAQFFDLTDKVSIADDGSFDWAADASFTIEFWMKTNQTDPPRNMVVIGRDGGPTALHWWIGTETNTGKVRFQLKDTSGNGKYLGDKGPALDDDVWHHIVAVRDESMNENRVYVDGGLADSGIYNYAANFVENVPVNVGYLELSNWYYYEGHLDELALYDRALGLTEIQNHYADGLTGKGYVGDGGTDTDGISDCVDNCPGTYNPDQMDADGDGVGDACDGCPDDLNKVAPGDCGCGVPDTDIDQDNIADCVDNCSEAFNPDQLDSDADGIGDECECTRANVNNIDNVNMADFAMVAEVWMTSDIQGDLDKDGDVDFNDIMQIAQWWLEDCVL